MLDGGVTSAESMLEPWTRPLLQPHATCPAVMHGFSAASGVAFSKGKIGRSDAPGYPGGLGLATRFCFVASSGIREERASTDEAVPGDPTGELPRYAVPKSGIADFGTCRSCRAGWMAGTVVPWSSATSNVRPASSRLLGLVRGSAAGTR